ncbi:uncharacterized protein LOC111677673 [Lucilia cuprina]|uniref:uncharacterized protein LOC111677673 n=1 Tax=Lucilia cuprina TaxID=7375 RepID=UPI001F061243|nr:uncharacterized protein LOC111677673 [Lucilia cuprina]
MASFGLKNKYFAKNIVIITRKLLWLYLFATALATSFTTTSTTVAANEITTTTNTNKSAALGSTTAATSTPQFPSLSGLFAWGHNTKYSTILFDENIIVKGSTFLDIKYPPNDDLYDDYTIIGIYAFVSDKLDTKIARILAEKLLSVYLIEGGIGHNFTKVRFASKALDDVECNLKIFGIYV